jgi:hypothetical protein
MMHIDPDSRFSSNLEAVKILAGALEGTGGLCVFISFSHADAQVVAPIIEKLKSMGTRIWWDKDIVRGSDWDDQVEQAMVSSDLMLVFVSPSAVASPESNKEWKYWMGEIKKPLIPVVIKDCRLPYRLYSLQRIDAGDKSNEVKVPDFICPIASGVFMTDSTSQRWRTRPVFISSTFRDMQAERDWLKHHVFPELAERLRQRRHFLEPIDLRFGVETVTTAEEEAKELLVLKVCLDEIRRSRPFIIVLRGERYGWVPDAARMQAAAVEAGFRVEVAGKSVTALEIEYGIFRESPDQQQRCFFYLRDPLPCERMPPEVAADHSEAHVGDRGAPAARPASMLSSVDFKPTPSSAHGCAAKRRPGTKSASRSPVWRPSVAWCWRTSGPSSRPKQKLSLADPT